MKKCFQFYPLLYLLMFLFNGGLVTAAEGILSNEDARSASADVLLAEVGVFKSIRQGLTLSINYCETTSACDSAATVDEVQQVINAVDQRIEGISQRQQEAGNSAGLEDVLVAYVDVRGGLNRVLKKVGDITSAVVENIDESELFGDDAKAATEGAEQFGDMFADEDEEL